MLLSTTNVVILNIAKASYRQRANSWPLVRQDLEGEAVCLSPVYSSRSCQGRRGLGVLIKCTSPGSVGQPVALCPCQCDVATIRDRLPL